MGDPDHEAPGRAQARYRNRRGGGWLTAAAVLVILGVGTAVWYGTRSDPTGATPTGTTRVVAQGHLPRACADALALADLLAGHVGPLAHAANDHVDTMERLELFLEGKPGGIDGHEAYRRGQPQMAVMEAHGPDAQVDVRRYLKVRKQCPSQ